MMKLIDQYQDIDLIDALEERYLAYALTTIMDRALPDSRDGLKPVHRRILYGMFKLSLKANSSFKKSARVVGDVMGRFHPHGDQAIYDTLVRLAQDFSVRWPLIDGQGNFGNIDGDNAAAMRYTEARMTGVANALLEGIDENSVDFRSTYDGEGSEPAVLPASFPNLLANGASGIAVGMATSIPPHNVGELCAALLHLIKRPNATINKLVELIPGPDLPTGGLLCEDRDSIVEAYKTGKGGFRVRATYEIKRSKGGGYSLIIKSIPFQVQKAKLIEKIAELMHSRNLTMIEDIRDESTTDIRLVIEPKSRNVDPDVLMESLFRQTDLESRVSLNMNVLDQGRVPRVMNLREVLQAFLDHRHEVLVRRKKYRLSKIEDRLEVLGGYLIAYLNIDEVIKIIREEDYPKEILIKKFKLSDVQVDAVLNMRLRHLRKLEEVEIAEEHSNLTKERTHVRGLLKDKSARWKIIAAEIKEIQKKFGPNTDIGRRRSEIGDAPTAVVIPMEAIMEREPVTVVCSAKGWARAVRGHLEKETELKYKEGDSHRFVLHAQTTDRLILFATNGRFYTVPVDRLPGGRGFGEPFRLMVDLPNDQDIVTLMVLERKAKLLIAASDGRGFIVKGEDVIAQTRGGKQVLNLGEGNEAAVCVPADGDHVAVVGLNRKLIIFPIGELPEMSRGRGVIMQRYNKSSISDAKVFNLSDGLSWKIGDKTRTEMLLTEWIGKRAQSGRIVPKGFAKSRRFHADI